MAAEPSSDVDPKKLPPLPKAMYSNQTESEVHLVLDARVQGWCHPACTLSPSRPAVLLHPFDVPCT